MKILLPDLQVAAEELIIGHQGVVADMLTGEAVVEETGSIVRVVDVVEPAMDGGIKLKRNRDIYNPVGRQSRFHSVLNTLKYTTFQEGVYA